MKDTELTLTKRKLLAGLGGAGVASLGAGLGTSALFSDSESFENNSLVAGEFDLEVSVDEVAAASMLVHENTTITPKDTADGAAVTIEMADVKPGDWLLLEWDPRIVANPGYVQVTSVDEDYANSEGENPESETDTSGDGDLGDALFSTIWHTYADTGDGTSRNGIEGLDETTDNNDSGLSNYEEPDLGGVTSGGAHYTTINEAHEVYKTGVLLRDPSSGDPLEVDSDGVSFYQLFDLPRGVGNEVQGDSVTFTLRFDAEQVRHNDDPFNNSG